MTKVDSSAPTLFGGTAFNVLNEPLIAYRRVEDARREQVSLPQLLAALVRNEVRDFPALRAHQRHPWHAFLCQLAAIALHRSGRTQPWTDAADWASALRALTPDHPDDSPWCLVAPPDRPALLQAPTVADLSSWKKWMATPDELDLLVTSKNHDLKASRAHAAEPQDWLFALVSLQTQEGFLGAGNYGISRMNGGFASRPGVGIAVGALPGAGWQLDVAALLRHRDRVTERSGLRGEGGHALIWLLPWDGDLSLAFASLDPHYIELCRRARLCLLHGRLRAVTTGSSVARIDAKVLNGRTGDPWTPVDEAAGKALTLNSRGYDYRLVSELLFGSQYTGGCAQELPQASSLPDHEPVYLSMRGLVRGQGKTEGFHERRVPIAPKVRRLLAEGQRSSLARVAKERIEAIAEIRKLLWGALVALFNNGKAGNDASDGTKDRANAFARALEVAEDLRFFDDLDLEVHADDAIEARLVWLIGLSARAEAVLRQAFIAGPRSGMQRLRAQSAALSRLHGGLRSDKAPAALRVLSEHLRKQSDLRKEQAHASTH